MSMQRSERTQRVIQAFHAGMIGSDIAREIGVTRQRVQQILAREGLSSREVQAQRAKTRAQWTAEACEQRHFAKYGMDKARLAELRSQGVLDAFHQQRKNAASRGIEWCFTFAQWHEVWEQSGHLAERGRGADAYCMSRKNDSGPYAPWNVTIKTNAQNSSEAFTKLRPTKRTPGVFLAYPGSRKPWLVKIQGRGVGQFATEAEAERVAAAYREEHQVRASKLGDGKGWTFVARHTRNPYYMQCGRVHCSYATQAEAEAIYAEVAKRLAAGESPESIRADLRSRRESRRFERDMVAA